MKGVKGERWASGRFAPSRGECRSLTERHSKGSKRGTAQAGAFEAVASLCFSPAGHQLLARRMELHVANVADLGSVSQRVAEWQWQGPGVDKHVSRHLSEREIAPVAARLGIEAKTS